MVVVKNDFIYQIILFVIPMIGLYWTLKDRTSKNERRVTVLEKDIENLQEFKKSAARRLDNHDEQNKAILVLAEQVKGLSDDIRELKSMINDK